MRKLLQRIHKSDVYVVCAILSLYWYTNRCINVIAAGGELNDALTVAWFTAWTAELAILAKLNDTKKKTRRLTNEQ